LIWLKKLFDRQFLFLYHKRTNTAGFFGRGMNEPAWTRQ